LVASDPPRVVVQQLLHPRPVRRAGRRPRVRGSQLLYRSSRGPSSGLLPRLSRTHAAPAVPASPTPAAAHARLPPERASSGAAELRAPPARPRAAAAGGTSPAGPAGGLTTRPPSGETPGPRSSPPSAVSSVATPERSEPPRDTRFAFARPPTISAAATSA